MKMKKIEVEKYLNACEVAFGKEETKTIIINGFIKVYYRDFEIISNQLILMSKSEIIFKIKLDRIEKLL